MAQERTIPLPITREEWSSEIKQAKLGSRDKADDPSVQYTSASQMLWHQYLLLRVIWKQRSQTQFHIRSVLGEEVEMVARDIVKESPDWLQYIAELPANNLRRTLPRKPIGLFKDALWQQLGMGQAGNYNDDVSYVTPQKELLEKIKPPGRSRSAVLEARADAQKGFSPIPPKRQRRQVERPGFVPSANIRGLPDLTPEQRTPRSRQDPTYAPIEIEKKIAGADEQITNAALILFLDALLDVSPQRALGHEHVQNELESTMKRKRLSFRNLWTAATDGYVRTLDSEHDIHAILEVKRFRRTKQDQSTRQQEAGEMVCWLASYPHDEHIGIISQDKITQGPLAGQKRYKRMLIAQDHDEFYIIIAEYTTRYLEYLTANKDPDEHTFMYLYEYGPFKLQQPGHMTDLAIILLAFFRRQNMRVKRRKRDVERRASSSTDSINRPMDELRGRDASRSRSIYRDSESAGRPRSRAQTPQSARSRSHTPARSVHEGLAIRPRPTTVGDRFRTTNQPSTLIPEVDAYGDEEDDLYSSDSRSSRTPSRQRPSIGSRDSSRNRLADITPTKPGDRKKSSKSIMSPKKLFEKFKKPDSTSRR